MRVKKRVGVVSPFEKKRRIGEFCDAVALTTRVDRPIYQQGNGYIMTFPSGKGYTILVCAPGKTLESGQFATMAEAESMLYFQARKRGFRRVL